MSSSIDFLKGYSSKGMYDYKPLDFDYSKFRGGSALGGGQYKDFAGYQDAFTPKKKDSQTFLDIFKQGLKKPDEDSAGTKIAESIYKSYRPEEKSSSEKIADLLASRMGVAGGSGVQNVAQGLTLANQGGGLQQPIIIPGEKGSGGIGGAVQGAAGGFLSGGPLGAVVGGIGGLFCDERVKEDIAPLQNSEVNDVLSECAFFVKDLNECS